MWLSLDEFGKIQAKKKPRLGRRGLIWNAPWGDTPGAGRRNPASITPPLWGLPAKSTTYSVTVQERHPLTGRKVQWARGPDPVMVTESAIPLSVECPRSHRGWRRDRKTNRNTAPGLVSSFQRKPATGSLQKGSYLLKKVELIPGVLKKKAALPGR